MGKRLWLVVLCCLMAAVAVAQENGARMVARANVAAYDDENGIAKLAYRDSPYYMELTGRWDQKQTDSSTLYSREIEVGKYWKDYQVTLNVRCGKGCRVVLNGKTVGYGGDSRHWNEYVLDKYLKYGKPNALTIEAVKQSREGHLESAEEPVGLNGEPYLLFKGTTNVADMTLSADYDASAKEGSLALDVSLFSSKKKGKYYLEVELWDPKGHTFDRMGRWVVFDGSERASVDMARTWNNVAPWTAETPNLYTVVLRLRNEDMEEEEVVGAKVGFRRVEVKDGVLQLNGKALSLKGVTYGLNRTEGFASRERIKKDLQAMKRMNINAVRTARFSPMEPWFYELCDEMGLYVVCDANLLPSSTQQRVVATDKEYIPLFERRVDNMYGKYKNHASIVAWSLGESRDNGVCMTAAYKRLKMLDKSRPVIYAGADFGENTDVIAQMHPTVKNLRQSLEKTGDRPLLMLAAVGENNFGELEPLWELVEGRRNLQGGFVDIWPLNALRQSELKNLFSPFDVHMGKTTIDDAEFTVYNRNDFSNFSQYILEYTIFSNFRPNISAGDLPVAIDGGGVEAVKLRIPPVDLQPGEEMMVRFDLERRDARAGSAERELGTVVFELPFKNDKKRAFVNRHWMTDGTLSVDSCDVEGERTRGLQIANAATSYPRIIFNPTTATINTYGNKGIELFGHSPVLRFEGHDDWKHEVVAVSYRAPDASTVCVDAMLRYTQGGREMCDVRVSYSFFGSGDVVVDYTLSPSDGVRGRLKPLVDIKLPTADNDLLQWFGLDREVCFVNRNAGVLGINSKPRKEMDGATRQEVRWCVNQKDPQNNLYMALLDQTFSMKVNGHTLTLVPSQEGNHLRLHMRGYVQHSGEELMDTSAVQDSFAESPEVFYTTEMPVVRSGILEPPQIAANSTRFTQPLLVSITAAGSGEIRYTIDGSEPTASSTLYSKPFEITTTTVVKAKVFANGMSPSFTAARKFNYDYIVSTTFSQKPNTPFNVGTDTILFDGDKGMVDNLSHGWLGFSGNGVTTTVRLSKSIAVEYVTLRYAHAPELWAFAPKRVSLQFSADGVTYGDTIHVEIPLDPTAAEASSPQVVEIKVPVEAGNVAYMKIEAESIGTIPSWHRAKGLKPWILMDEITIGESTPTKNITSQ